MATLTDEITQALLDASGDPAGLDDVRRRHSSSRGPYYTALGTATNIMEERIRQAGDEYRATQDKLKQARDLLETVRGEAQKESTALASLRKERETAEQDVDALRGLLGRADSLARQGFGERELDRLADSLARIAAAQGATPETAVAAFFELLGRWDKVLSLEVERERAENAAATAKARQDRAEAETLRVEAKSKLRIEIIAILEALVSQGVKEQDIRHWQGILAKAGIGSIDLATALQQYASLDALTRARRKEADVLQRDVRRMRAEVSSLDEQKANLQAAVQAVGETAVHGVQRATKAVEIALGELLSDVDQTYAKAYRRGWSDAEDLYRVDFPCWKCGEPIPLGNSGAKKTAAAYLHDQGWAHPKCLHPESATDLKSLPAPARLPFAPR